MVCGRFSIWSVVGGEFLVWSVVFMVGSGSGRWSVFCIFTGRWSVIIFENGRWSVP